MDLSRKRAREQEEKEEEEERIEQVKAFEVAVTGFTAAIVAWHHFKFLRIKEPLPDWDEHRQFYLNRLCGSEVECMENLRVSKHAFSKLCQVVYDKGGLRRTRHVSIEESVAIFLNILGHNVKFRSIHLNFYRSKETISRQFNRVLCAVLRTSKEYLKYDDCVLEGTDLRRWRWFENCLGALDGTHVPVTVRAAERPRYQNRKGDISSNVLGVCNPDMRFIYVLARWEGSASDSRVLKDALSRPSHLVIPNDKYYLVDAGYTNRLRFLAPYRGTRYHLKEWSGNRPQNFKELFNLRYSKARNVIERAFGVLKKRWSILRTASFFDIKTQVRIINACCILHNFIRIEKHNDPLLEADERHLLHLVDGELLMRPIEINEDEVRTVETTNEWTAFRDHLAADMFADYQMHRAQQAQQEQGELANVN